MFSAIPTPPSTTNAPEEVDVDPVVPLIVTSLVIVRSFPIVTSFGKPIVTEAVSEPEPLTSISLAVPEIVAT
jgi:hypothetical protein